MSLSKEKNYNHELKKFLEIYQLAEKNFITVDKDNWMNYATQIGYNSDSNIVKDFINFIEQKIRTAISNNENGLDRVEIYRIKRQCYIEKIINGENRNNIANIIDTIYNSLVEKKSTNNHIIHKIYGFQYKEKWLNVINLANVINQIDTIYDGNLDIGTMNSAEAIKNFIADDINVKWHVSKYNIHIDNDSEKAIMELLENLILKLGADYVLRHSLVGLSQYYNEELDRFTVNRKTHTMSPERDATTPFLFLINLSCKFLDKKNFIDINDVEKEKTWKTLQNKAKDYVAIYNTEDYVPYNFLNIENFIPEIIKMRTFDWVFIPRQFSKNQIIYIIDNFLLKFQVSEKTKSFIKDTSSLLLWLFELCKSEKVIGFIPIDKNDVRKKYYFNEYFSLMSSKEQINKDYNELNDKNLKFNNTIYANPIIDNGDNFLIINPHIASYAFFEKILGLMRKEKLQKDNYNNNLGSNAEKLLFNLFTQYRNTKDIKIYHNLEYDKEMKVKDNRDCDIFVETSDTVIFFEVKTKSLTMDSLLGYDFNQETEKGWLKDLSDAFFKPLLQLIRHEDIIKKNSFIKFKNSYKLEYCNRKIIKIIVSLCDYTSFYDTSVVRDIKELIKRGMILNTAKQNKDIDKINKTLQSIFNLVKDNNDLMDNLYFTSIPYIITVLEREQDILSMINTIQQNITFGTREPYVEYLHMSKIKNSSQNHV